MRSSLLCTALLCQTLLITTLANALNVNALHQLIVKYGHTPSGVCFRGNLRSHSLLMQGGTEVWLKAGSGGVRLDSYVESGLVCMCVTLRLYTLCMYMC